MMNNEAAEKALRRLTAIMADYESGDMPDREDTHYYGDQAIVEMIRELGYEEVANAWENLPKWYA